MKAIWFVGLALVGCNSAKKQREPSPSEPSSGSSKDLIVQPRFSAGQEAPSDVGRLDFTITKVDKAQRPSTTPPFHEAGGNWTYIEAQLDGDPTATFIVGMPKLPTSSDATGLGGFGKLMFAPTTSVAGARIIDRLAKVLGTSAPSPKSGGVLQAVKVPTAVLGHDIGKLDNGMGGRGSWDAMKLFCSSPGIDSAELFFNFSLADKHGEFSEKDTDYNKDVVACLATILRDGLPPPRTPANDPTLTAAGPRLQLGQKIGNARMQELALSAGRLLMLEERGTKAAVVDIDVKTGAAKDLYTTPDRLDRGSCDDGIARCVLKISTPKEGRNSYGNDPSRLVLLDSNKVTPLAIGKVTNPELPGAALSPDGRFVVAMDYESRPSKLVALDRTTKRTYELAGADSTATELVAWDGTTAIVVRTPYDEGKQSTVIEWQLGANGAAKPSTRSAEGPLVSPDGTRRATFADSKLTITAGSQSRTLALHPEDARSVGAGCCTWIDNRWLSIRGGFIDTDAMKVSLSPLDADSDPPQIAYVRGARIAVVFREDGAYLATIVGP